MKWIPTLLVASTSCVSYATTYMSVEQAQNIIFPNKILQLQNVQLSNTHLNQLKRISKISYPLKTNQIFKTKDHEWLIIDQVLGKHEMITYAVGLNADGSVKQIEILEYNESYGSQVNNKSWKNQFVGKNINTPLILNQDIQNISGATLSSKHITDGVRRIVNLYNLVLKNA